MNAPQRLFVDLRILLTRPRSGLPAAIRLIRGSMKGARRANDARVFETHT